VCHDPEVDQRFPKLDEVARILAIQKAPGLVACTCSCCNYTTSEILPALGSKRED
jgi:hypothetical protein